MIQITLPDGSHKSFESAPTVAEVAASIGSGLARATLAGKVDDQLVDASHVIDHDARLEIITEKSPEALDVIRHSTAHLLAQATQRLFPETQVTIGPVIDNGFYYDFARRSRSPRGPGCHRGRDAQDRRREAARGALGNGPRRGGAFFRDKGEEYKAEIILDIPEDETLSLYKQGEFIDLCRGPHVPDTGQA